jgi:zona occludens toxin
MISLITGTPGAGKSAYAMSLMLKVLKEGRPLFVHGVPDLLLPHVAVSCDSPTCKACTSLDWPTLYRMPAADKWIEWAPDGSVLFFDEVQNVHRPRPAGSKVPEAVARYETHRHSGLDAFFVTQHPRLIDNNVRQLVGRHVHLVSSWKGRTMYDWPECSDTLSNKHEAIKSGYKLPTHVFKLYKSASLHVKPIRQLPPQIYAIGVILLLIGLVSYRVYSRVAPEPSEQQTAQNTNPEHQPTTNNEPEPQKNKLSQFDYQPQIANYPESAPAFADLAKPVSFPRLAGCVVNRNNPDSCRCYTQQGTPYFVSRDMCMNHVDHGRFNPYLADSARAGVASTGRNADTDVQSTQLN